ncbi:nitrate reductase [Natrarchaeobius halalkaliphilus]|uniref:Nitrate reductase n=1 Tax=Natrarchaeobius halalkaliphilus TaxID=1679091 RepID=A0A3N6NYS1_9EURY|nr:assimilatory nitrate reductase NasA [Natrarchaeobius halalkaliphilus]RQG86212.1 nitrate reductase [Natrarchaeobius halalkaliphilus]
MSEFIQTTCLRCAVGCGHVQRAVDNGYGLDLVRGNPEHPVNNGLACQRGVRETADPDGEWLTRPLVRRDGELVATTLDNALEEAADGLAEALEASSDAVAVLGSGQQTNEAAYALGKLARGGFGTRYYDANTTLCMASAVTAYYDAFGSDAPPPTYGDIPDAETHLIWGANPAVAHPVMFSWIRQSVADNDSELLVIDPVHSETAEVADYHVPVEPGGDLALARAILARIVETDRVDETFVAEQTEGFEELLETLPSGEAATDDAGVSLAAVDKLARAFETRTLVYWGMGVNQSAQGTATAGALIDLCLATGNLKPGSGPFSLTGQANSMGTRVCSSKGSWPGHRSFDDPIHRGIVADTWGVSPSRLPDDTGPGPVGIVEAIDTDIDAIYAVATNPAAGLPDAGAARNRLEESFLVVQDAFHSETVELADVVLPAATWGESEGTVMNMERTISRVRAATDTPSGIKTDLELIGEVATRVVPGLFDEPPEPKAVFKEFVNLTEGTVADCSGIGYERLEAEHAVRWPAPSPTTAGGYRYYTDEADEDTVNENWEFPTPTGRARFSSAVADSVPEPPSEAYPLTLTTARGADAYNTGVRTREDEPPIARINPATASAMATEIDGHEGDSDGESTVRVTSRRASIDARVEEDDAIPDSVVWLPIHHPAVNDLTLPTVDPRSNEPNFKQCAIRLEAPRNSEEIASAEGSA